MHAAVHKKIKLGFYIAFAVMVGASVFSYLIAINLINNATRLNHSIEVSKRLEIINKDLKEAEAAVRGYSITHDTAFLHPTMQERSFDIERQYRQLRRLTGVHKQQQEHLDTLKQLLDAKYMQLMLAAKSDTPNGESEEVQQGQIASNRIEKKIKDMTHIEDQLLIEKSALFNFFSSLWVPVIFVTSLLAIIISLYSFVVMNKEYRLQLHIDARLKQYQQELQQHISLLHKSNQELEQFAYVASHDLQEPLRKITTFSDRLQGKYGTLLPADGLELIDRMNNAVGRMRVLISDLLTFSRAGRITPESFTEVDLNTLVQNVQSDLEVVIQEKNATIQSEVLPTLTGSPTSLHQLFLNLMGNAIKFASPQRPLVITITSTLLAGQALQGLVKDLWTDEDFCRITVADNGIGFEQEYADRIFLLFQRLHGVSEYSGTGIGLAICKKIVESHHGTIQAFGTPGVGARFEIFLPLKQRVNV